MGDSVCERERVCGRVVERVCVGESVWERERVSGRERE